MVTFRWVFIVIAAVCLVAATFGALQFGPVHLLPAGLLAWLIADHVTVHVAS